MNPTVLRSGLCVMVASVMVVLLSSAGAKAAPAAGFSAQLVETRSNRTRIGKIYVLGDRYRLDMKEDDRPLQVIVDQKAGMTRVIVLQEQVFLEFANTDMKSLRNNPFAAYAFMVKQYETRDAGSEPIGDISCTKQVITAQNKDLMTVWLAPSYPLPLKMVNQMGQRTIEIKAIDHTAPAATLFATPAGFTKVERMPVPPPSWAKQLSAAPLQRAPGQWTVKPGGLLRIQPLAGFHLQLNAKNPGKTNASFTAVAFKDGRPFNDPSMSTFALRAHSSVRTTHKQPPSKADFIAVRVKKAPVTVTATPIEAPAGIMLQKFYQKRMSGREIRVDGDKKTLLRLTDAANDDKASRGQLTLFKGIKRKSKDATIYEKKQVKQLRFKLKNGATRVWTFPRTQGISVIGIDVLDGGVDIRIEQPEKAGTTPPAWGKPALRAVN